MLRLRSRRIIPFGLLAVASTMTPDATAQGPLPPLPSDASRIIAAPHGHGIGPAHAQPSLMARLNPFRPFDPSAPLTVPELCKKIDGLSEELRDDGLILLKQPDVFSQARLTRFRNDFDNQMSSDLGNFHLVLAARISRLDSATTTQTTALGAALSAPGTTNVAVPDATKFIGSVSGTNSPFANSNTSLFPTNGTIDPKNGAFGNLGLGSSTMAMPSGGGTLALGVDPTVYLDEKKRFLEHLNQIRRISMGPDQNDSSGYGLYLVRMPISIQPGECTYSGHGADFSLNVEHEFPPDFLPSTFQNLVINDLVDVIGPFLYELIRTGKVEDLKKINEAKHRRPFLEARNRSFLTDLAARLAKQTFEAEGQPLAALPDGPSLTPNEQRARLMKFILRRSSRPTGDPAVDKLSLREIISRLQAAADFTGKSDFAADAEQIEREKGLDLLTPSRVEDRLPALLDEFSPPEVKKTGLDRPLTFVVNLYRTALPDDVKLLDDLLGVSEEEREDYTRPLAENNREAARVASFDEARGKSLAPPSSRSSKQQYPIAPRNLLSYFLSSNVYLIANDVRLASRTSTPNLNNVRAYLRQSLLTAYVNMSLPSARDQGEPLPLADPTFMDRLGEAIRQREFFDLAGEDPRPTNKSGLEMLNDELIGRLMRGRDNMKGTPMGALCWAIAVDAAVLDLALRRDADRVFEAKGLPPSAQLVKFYIPGRYPNPEGSEVFCQYVKNRWPIVTFSLDPVTDQQNIADTFNLKRDLQLAVSFAFATGQINFNQLNTFRRQIEQSSDTIALNRTVTSFSSGTDNFGFRFTPRFQNPPAQRSNLGVIASQLISGGPGPDYQVKKSKLEPGMRELTAVLLVPDFLPTMRLNAEGNWFKLNDPEHLVYHTGRAMERGRRVQELRKAVLDACSAENYRGEDLRILQRKLAQLEAMLPIQSKVVQLPYDNQANGFDLLSDGATALAPELTGYSGVDVITAPSAASGANPAGTTFPAQGSTGVQLLTTTNPTGTTQTVSLAGGSASIADLFVNGKFLNLLDTNFVVGGRSAAFQLLSREVAHVQVPASVIPTTTDDGKTYLEIYASTPNGISNTLLVPYHPGSTPPSRSAYDLAAASGTQTIYYQPIRGPEGTVINVPSVDPGKYTPITIGWDDAAGLAPKRLRVLFSGTINGQSFRFAMDAAVTGTDDYTIDQLRFFKDLLRAIQPIAGAAAGGVPPSVTLSLSVLPFQPNDADNYRVRSTPKPLKTKMTVNFQFFSVPARELPRSSGDDQGASPPPGDGRALATSTVPKGVGEVDPDIARTAQQVPSPLSTLPRSLNLPQPPPVAPPPTLLAPNAANEAEQVARMLTGLPLPPPPPGGQTNTVISSTTSKTPAASQAQPIVVTPAPVVVVPAKEIDKGATQGRRKHQGLFKRLGNRMSNAMSGPGN